MNANMVKVGAKVIWQERTASYTATYEGQIHEVLQDCITVLTAYSPNPKTVSLENPTLWFVS